MTDHELHGIIEALRAELASVTKERDFYRQDDLRAEIAAVRKMRDWMKDELTEARAERDRIDHVRTLLAVQYAIANKTALHEARLREETEASLEGRQNELIDARAERDRLAIQLDGLLTGAETLRNELARVTKERDDWRQAFHTANDRLQAHDRG